MPPKSGTFTPVLHADELEELLRDRQAVISTLHRQLRRAPTRRKTTSPQVGIPCSTTSDAVGGDSQSAEYHAEQLSGVIVRASWSSSSCSFDDAGTTDPEGRSMPASPNSPASSAGSFSTCDSRSPACMSGAESEADKGLEAIELPPGTYYSQF